MGQIREQIGFEVGSAIKAIDTLNKRLGRLVGGFERLATAMRNVNSVAGNVDRKLNNTGSAAGKAGSRAQSAGKGFTNLGNSMKNAGGAAGGFSGSMGNLIGILGRVTVIQVGIRLINGLQQALSDATSSAIEFQRSVAEIRTIDGLNRSAESLEGTIRGISDAFNLPLGDVAEGLYQTISNQIQGAANQQRVLAASARFAKTAQTTLADSIKLLTGRLNAFGLSASDVDKEAARFFKTIELGRTRGSELAQVLGRVDPIASRLGVTTSEVNAALATLTIRGLSTSEAGTQLIGTLNALIKPSDDLKKVFDELGVSSGEELLRAFGGLDGAVAALQRTAGDTTTEAGRLVRRVRGLTGFLSLGEDGAKRFSEAIREIESTSVEEAAEALAKIQETDAERVTKQLRELKNALTLEFGQAALAAADDLLKFIGGVDKAKELIADFSPALVQLGVLFAGVTVALGVIGIAFKAVAVSQSALAAGFLPLLEGLAALGPLGLTAANILTGAVSGALRTLGAAIVGNLVGAAIGNALDRARETVIGGLEKLSIERAQVALEASEKEREIEDKKNQAIIQGFQKLLVEQNKVTNKRNQVLERGLSAAITSAEKLLTRIGSRVSSEIRRLEGELDRIEDRLKSVDQLIAETDTEISDTRFEGSLQGLPDATKFNRTLQRGLDIARDARSELAAATTDDQSRAALDNFQRALGFIREAGSFTEGNTTRQRQQNQALVETLRLRREGAKAFRGNVESDKRSTIEQIKRQKDVQKSIDSTSIALRERIKALRDADTTEERQQIAGQIRDLFVQVARDATASRLFQDIDFGDPKKLGEQIRSAARLALEDADFTSIIKEIEAAPAAIEGFIGQIEANARAVRLVFQTEAEGLEQVLGQDVVDQRFQGSIDTTKDLSGALDLATKNASKLRQALNIVAASDQAIADLGTSIEGTLSQRLNVAGDSAGEELARRLRDRIVDLANNPDQITGGALEKLKKLIQAAFAATGDFDIVDRANFTELLRTVVTLQKIRSQQEAGQQSLDKALGIDGATVEQATQRLQGLESVIKRIGSRVNISKLLDGVPGSAETAGNAITSNIGQALQGEIQRARELGQILNNIRPPATASPGAGGATQGRATGGLVRFFNNGGFVPRGTDTIPAMLSPKEFVVNARSTQKFFSELQAINAGVRPVFRQDGGVVNNNVGDINVNVNGGGKDAGKTGREVARSIQREMRRRTVSLS